VRTPFCDERTSRQRGVICGEGHRRVHISTLGSEAAHATSSQRCRWLCTYSARSTTNLCCNAANTGPSPPCEAHGTLPGYACTMWPRWQVGPKRRLGHGIHTRAATRDVGDPALWEKDGLRARRSRPRPRDRAFTCHGRGIPPAAFLGTAHLIQKSDIDFCRYSRVKLRGGAFALPSHLHISAPASSLEAAPCSQPPLLRAPNATIVRIDGR
jgi:hypothetical protein